MTEAVADPAIALTPTPGTNVTGNTVSTTELTTPAPTAPAGAAAALTEPVAVAAPAITLPGKEATPADWSAYYKAIGAPDATALAGAITVPEGADKAFATEAATQMAEVGLLPHQAQKLAEWWNSKSTTAVEAHKAEATRLANEAAVAAEAKVNAEDAALKNEWQSSYDANVEAAKRAVRQFLPKEKAADAIGALERSLGYGATMRLMHKIGAGLAEGQMRGDGQQPGEAAVKSIAERLYGST